MDHGSHNPSTLATLPNKLQALDFTLSQMLGKIDGAFATLCFRRVARSGAGSLNTLLLDLVTSVSDRSRRDAVATANCCELVE